MIVKLMLFRIFNVICMVIVSLIVYKISITNARSTFNCHVSYSDVYSQTIICSIQGVQVRQWISILWVAGYAFLALLLAVGTFADLSGMKELANKRGVLELFKIVVPELNTANAHQLTDLKLITLLASKNSEQILVKYIFQRLETARTFHQRTGVEKHYNATMVRALDLIEHDLKAPEFGEEINNILKSVPDQAAHYT